MWTEQSRGRMAKIAKKTKRYPSDLTDEEWEAIAPLMPQPGGRGRPREVEFREVINAVRYLVRSGCGWRMLPVHFGHWRTDGEPHAGRPLRFSWRPGNPRRHSRPLALGQAPVRRRGL